MKPKRPVFLELWRIKLPAMGLASILHRVSGVLMVLAIPLGAHLLHQSLASPEGFAATAATLSTWPLTSIWDWSARRLGAAPRS
jgi:succinate dehydrogenase / fumarate reductase cytochrome b subunit